MDSLSHLRRLRNKVRILERTREPMICVSPKQVIVRSFHMETRTTNEVREHVHYDHNDDCRFSRWTARESYRFMYDSRPWNSVLGFYANLVAHGTSSSLASLFGRRDIVYDDSKDQDLADEKEEEDMPSKKGNGRWARVTFKVVLSYDGPSFDGWQKQPALNTVQGLVESSLNKFSYVDDKKRDKGVVVVVAGRTDKGVTALNQVCSFYTWRKDIEHKDIEEAINSAAPGKLSVKSVSQVSRVFHPNFSAKWRRYLYIFPLDNEENGESVASHESDEINESQEDLELGEKPRTFEVKRVNRLLRQLEGKLLSYKMFARDTKASRNVGPPTECFMYHARAAEARLPRTECLEGRRVMCVELVANRFLRKMVRVLVATAIREAAAGAEEDALLKLMDATCRRATAPPAPPDGLCLVDVGYTDFNPRICLVCKE